MRLLPHRVGHQLPAELRRRRPQHLGQGAVLPAHGRPVVLQAGGVLPPVEAGPPAPRWPPPERRKTGGTGWRSGGGKSPGSPRPRSQHGGKGVVEGVEGGHIVPAASRPTGARTCGTPGWPPGRKWRRSRCRWASRRSGSAAGTPARTGRPPARPVQPVPQVLLGLGPWCPAAARTPTGPPPTGRPAGAASGRGPEAIRPRRGWRSENRCPRSHSTATALAIT